MHRHKTPHIAKLVALFIAVIACVAGSATLSPRTAFAQALERASQSLDIAASIGFQRQIQLDRWTPVTITVRNTGTSVNGYVELLVADTQRRVDYQTHYRQPLALASGAQKRLHFTIYLSRVTEPLTIRIVTGAGVVASHSVELHSKLSSQRFIATLGKDINLDYLNDRDTYRTQVVYPLPGFLPTHWRGYDGVEAIVLHRFALRPLAANQYKALRNWIYAGGTLVVSGGYDSAILRTPRISQLLPAQVVGTVQLNTDYAMHRALGFGVADERHALTLTQPIGLTRVSSNANVLHQIDNLPLVLEHQYGRGNVVLLTFDLASAPFANWSGMPSLMNRIAGLSSVLPVTLQHQETTGQNRKAPLSRLIREHGQEYPNHATVLAFATLYLTILALAARKFPRNDSSAATFSVGRYWFAFIVPVGFSVLAAGLFHQLLFPQKPTIASLAVLEPVENSTAAVLHLKIRAHSTRPDPLEFRSAGANPLLRTTATIPNRRYATTGPRFEPWVFQQGATPAAKPLNAGAYTEFRVRGNDLVDFAVSANYRQDHTLDFHNRSGRDLTHLIAITNDSVFNLGNVASGESLSGTLQTGLPLRQSTWRDQLISQHPAGTATVAAIDEILQGEFGPRLSQGSQASVLLIGFTSNPWKIEKTSNLEHLDLSMMAWRINQRKNQNTNSTQTTKRGQIQP